MLLQVMLWSLQGMCWQLLQIADLPIYRTAENRMLASVTATKMLR